MNIMSKKIDYEKIIEELLKDEHIMKAVSDNELTKEQIIEAIPILIDMKNQNHDKTNYVISFYVSKSGNVMRQEILSSSGEENMFKKNILTLDISAMDFSESIFFKEESRKELVNKFNNFLQSNDQFHKGFYIYGDMGIGKTFMAKKFLVKLAKKGKTVGMVNLAELNLKIKSTFNGNEDYYEIINTLKMVDYLFIDDIGAESISSWFRDDILFSILNFRMDRKKATFFTSNYSIKDLMHVESKTIKSKYKDYDKARRLIERITALSIEVHLTGKNFR